MQTAWGWDGVCIIIENPEEKSNPGAMLRGCRLLKNPKPPLRGEVGGEAGLEGWELILTLD